VGMNVVSKQIKIAENKMNIGMNLHMPQFSDLCYIINSYIYSFILFKTIN